jgi:transposase-like protein
VRGGRTITEVARDLGVCLWSFRQWVKDAQSGRSLREPKTLAAETPGKRELWQLRQENDSLRRQREISKKCHEHILRGPAERYALINAMRENFQLTELCEALGVSRSGCFAASQLEARSL